MSGDWRDLALCIGENPELFFPTGPHHVPARTLDICARCAVTDQCLHLALTLEHGAPRDARFGIWGGLSPTQRFNLARRRARSAA